MGTITQQHAQKSRTKQIGMAQLFVLLVAFLAYSCNSEQKSEEAAKGSPEFIKQVTGAVDDEALKNAENDSKNWLSYGASYSETRFSKLNEITTENVKDLGLVWEYDLESNRGVEATPVVVDGIMYVTASWSIVHAIDARTGERIWTFDPEVPGETGRKACCDVVNRGVAVYKGKVFVASLDGRLFALDAATGKKIWEKVTVDQTKDYTVTGAPRIIKGNVIIGNGGAEYGVRGYLTAYDAETGDQKWRWYSIPGDPNEPYEQPELKMAAETWDPSSKYWEFGAGGTMWDAIVYDPELDMMYVGVGNGTPWNQRNRSPKGGDNLFLSSIVALDPDDGTYKWHYQETPGDFWDYTSTQQIILTELELDGEKRKVLMHAPKNGFFFVIDRTNGEFISAKNFVSVNWAQGYDEEGRPIVNEFAKYDTGNYEAIPGPFGAHNWHPMSYNPNTGLVYIPAHGIPFMMADDEGWTYHNTDDGRPHTGPGFNLGIMAPGVPPKTAQFGHLLAWDPVKQEAAWKVDLGAPWNGGTVTTQGNLVFQGTADGRFVAYNAENGEKLWEVETGTGVVAAPVTYEVDGQQYVSIAVGWGGIWGLATKYTDKVNYGKVYTFAVGGAKQIPAVKKAPEQQLVQGIEYKPEDIPAGAQLYIANCIFCHGVPAVDKGGALPNLGYAPVDVIKNLDLYVLDGVKQDLGMPSFEGKLTKEEVTKIQTFIQYMADQVAAQQAAAE